MGISCIEYSTQEERRKKLLKKAEPKELLAALELRLRRSGDYELTTEMLARMINDVLMESEK